MTATLLFLLIYSSITGQHGTIAFVTGENQEQWRLCLADVESGGITPIGQGMRDSNPQWSPDGSMLAYQSKGENGISVHVIDMANQSDNAIPHRYASNEQPRWSPEGRRLAYASEGDSPPLKAIVVYDIDKREETIWGGDRRGLLRPVWMPTTDMMKALDPEDKVAAEALGLVALKAEAEQYGVIIAIGIGDPPPEMTTEIFIITPTLAVPLLPFLDSDSHRYVKWFVEPEHKGRQLAYESNDGGDRELFVLGRKGIINVSNHPAADWHPIWSPDNYWLAFESFRGGRQGIYRLLVSTANVIPIVAAESYDCWSPAWSPNGDHLVFVSNKTGTPQLYIIDKEGKTMRQLTNGATPALCPAWRPATREQD